MQKNTFFEVPFVGVQANEDRMGRGMRASSNENISFTETRGNTFLCSPGAAKNLLKKQIYGEWQCWNWQKKLARCRNRENVRTEVMKQTYRGCLPSSKVNNLLNVFFFMPKSYSLHELSTSVQIQSSMLPSWFYGFFFSQKSSSDKNLWSLKSNSGSGGFLTSWRLSCLIFKMQIIIIKYLNK